MRPTALLVLLIMPWNNGHGDGGARTDTLAECTNPPYSTHDWIAEHALEMLPAAERAWIEPHRNFYRIGTEAPDNSRITADCATPHTGYGDTGAGHSVDWNADHSAMIVDQAAVRAQEEYDKAAAAFASGDPAAAAFFLGAMAHYIGDVSQFGHTIPDEDNHGNYEGWVGRRTDSFNEGVFEIYLRESSLVRRVPFTAVRRISMRISEGWGTILPAEEMDDGYDNGRPQPWVDSIGESLNLGVNELADVLHRFFLNEVQTDS